MTPNPSLQPTCYGLRPPHAAELKRWAFIMSRACSIICACFLLSLCCSFSSAYAEAVNPATVFDSSHFDQAQQLKAILEQPENGIDFARVKLTIDKMVDPSIDVEANVRKIDAIVKTIKTMLVADATSMDKMLAIKKYLYEDGAWNDYLPYRYDFDDPKGVRVINKLLPNYLVTKKGNCVSMPLLFIILGQRLGIDVTASTAPKHLLVKYTDNGTGQTYNLEATSGANFSRDVWYQQTMNITNEALANRIYLQKLSKQETVAVMATVLAESYLDKQEYEKAMMISEMVLRYFKNDVDVMLMKGVLFYRLLAKNYLKKYPAPNLIPEPERPYFQFLSTNNLYWFEKAEKLGWRELTPEDEQDYLKIVKRDADKLRK